MGGQLERQRHLRISSGPFGELYHHAKGIQPGSQACAAHLWCQSTYPTTLTVYATSLDMEDQSERCVLCVIVKRLQQCLVKVVR